MTFIGIDDTDNPTSGGTGRVARALAALLRERGLAVLGVSRHQLLVDPRIPYTSNNSCNVLHLLADDLDLAGVADSLSAPLLERCLEGSNPGLCIGIARKGDPFGSAAQMRVVSQAEAFGAAHECGAVLRSLGGTGDGVIGAMAGVLLAAGGNDGRFVEVGRARELDGVVPVAEALAAGIAALRTCEGEPVGEGDLDTLGGRVRPLLRGARPVLLVEPAGPGRWRVVEQGKRRSRRQECRPCQPPAVA